LAAGGIVTYAGCRLIERAHPPRGRFVPTRGGRQHVIALGAGRAADAPPIVLIHGAGCNLEDMSIALGERLAARHHVILIDRAGLGWSERGGRAGSTPAFQAAVLREVLDRVAVAPAIVVGHSWGGALAAAVALDHPDRVAGLVLLAPPLYPFSRGMTWLYTVFATPVLGWLYARTLALPLGALFIGPAFASAFMPQLPPGRYVKSTAAMLLLRPATFLANARDVAGLTDFLARQAGRYPDLNAPTVIMTGSRDVIVPWRLQARRFAAAVTRAKLVVLPGIGHMLHHAAAEQVVAEIEEIARRSSDQ